MVKSVRPETVSGDLYASRKTAVRTNINCLLEQIVELCKRKFLGRFGCNGLAVYRYFISFRIYGNFRCTVVEYHILLGNVSASFYRHDCFFQAIRLLNTRLICSLRRHASFFAFP